MRCENEKCGKECGQRDRIWSPPDLCGPCGDQMDRAASRADEAETRAAILESAVCRLLNIVGSKDDVVINAALDFARKALANG